MTCTLPIDEQRLEDLSVLGLKPSIALGHPGRLEWTYNCPTQLSNRQRDSEGPR